MSTTGERGRPPVRVGASIVDLGTGMWAVIGILTALYRLKETNRGGVIDVSLFETAATWVSLLAANYLASNEEPPKQGSGAIGIVPYRAYASLDGDLVVAAGSDALFRRLAAVLGHPEWAEDPRFSTNPLRVLNQSALYPLIEAEMAKRNTADWMRLLEDVGIPCSPVQTIGQMLAHEQTQALGVVQPVPDSGMRFIGLPISFDGTRPAIRMRPPKLGEHTSELGVTQACPAAAAATSR
jgi:crotonobetainyl-CoA:carnitine CoA-transferase CaiB-like acyl-CoA transferase